MAESAPNTYIYDEIGNLVEDVEEGTLVDWTPYGKVRKVTKTADNLTINYRYDAAGNRVAKITDKDGEVTTNRYIRDASGNVMAVYQDTLTLEHHTFKFLEILSIIGFQSSNLSAEMSDIINVGHWGFLNLSPIPAIASEFLVEIHPSAIGSFKP